MLVTRGKHTRTDTRDTGRVGSGQARLGLGTGDWGTRVYMADFPLKAKFGGEERRARDIGVSLFFLTIFWHRAQ